MKHTSVEPSSFGVALVAWLVACASLGSAGVPFNPKNFVKFAAAALGLLGVIALLATRRSKALAARRNQLALELMATRNKFMHTAESVRIGRTFPTRKDDVFVVTYPKCGTTWMTQICHALRTRGSMDFEEIQQVVPWDILAHDCGQDLKVDHVTSPRVFKSHESFQDIAKGGRYIYVARNPQDAFYSFYKFLPAYTGLAPDDIDEQTFADAIFAGTSHSGQIWDHMLGWWEQRAAPNVLWVFFEDLATDLRGQVERVAKFMGLEASDKELIDAAVRVSSFDFMSSQQHAHQFDDHFVRSHILPKMGLPADKPLRVSKVRRDGGKVGTRRKLPHAVSLSLRHKWQKVLAGPTGCADYEAFRACIQSEQLD
jgi:hypothetical protein